MKDRPRTLVVTGAAPMAQAFVRSIGSAELDVVAIASSSSTPAANAFTVRPNSVESQGLQNIVHAAGLPLVAVADDADLVDLVTRLQPDLLLSVCFPSRIPGQAVALTRNMAINLHPSALPAWRGPDPLFWQIRHGLTRIEVCWHVIAQRMDDGEVLARTAVNIGQTDTETIIEGRVADAGIGCLHTLLEGGRDVASLGAARGRWWRSPAQGDYRIFRSWTCRHAERFITAFSKRGQAFVAPGPEGHVWITGLASAADPPQRVVAVNLLDGAIRARIR